ncbi:MAG TPA: trehalose-6-phosphate synthase [Gemmatimonadaceae bacterium]|jgi:trehalose 6-phosphate synthase|nr:trehalose-6-phosphate synthase [Gemmatimonadaceae bacterium]
MFDISQYLDACKLILVSNREPYEHMRGVDGIEVKQPAGGLVSALDPTMRRTHGTWVAWGSGTADREVSDECDRVAVPPGEDSYTLRRVWLDESDVGGFYHGFANQALWPLCHMLIQHFEFRTEHWDRYRTVNLRFAHAVAEEEERLSGKAMVWIQDYHFALAAEYLRAMRPNLFVHQFWHIPFPPVDILRLLPPNVCEAVLRGLLGNDLVEFQIDRYAVNFLGCVDTFIEEARVDHVAQMIEFCGRRVHVGAFPISIDVSRFEEMSSSPDALARVATLRQRYAKGKRQLGVCVDRLDYTKGIPERIRALDELWTESPELRDRFSFIFVCTPSRTEVAAYNALEHSVTQAIIATNEKFGHAEWTPIVMINENVDADLLASVYRAGDLCIVSSLQDGMNLVGKEFVACQLDERGVLILSRFTGSAEEIEGALLINPFNVDGFVGGIRAALEMSPEERRRRMRRMRRQLHHSTIFDWLDSILARSTAIMRELRAAPPTTSLPAPA